MNSTLRQLTVAAVAVAAFAGLQPNTAALRAAAAGPYFVSFEVVRLRTGESIKGRLVVEKCNEAIAVVEDYVSGAFREVAWPAIEERDERRLKELLGIEDRSGQGGGKGAVTMECEIIVYRLSAGTTEVRGGVQSEDENSVLLKTAGGVLTIPKAQIASREKAECDATDIYTSDELAAHKKEEINAQTARDWFRLGQYCVKVGAYVQAKEAFEFAATDTEFLNHTAAVDWVTKLTALLKDQEALATIRDLKMALQSNLFAKVRTGIEKFGEKHPDASKPVLEQVEALKGLLKKQRDTFFASEANRTYLKVLEKLILAKVKVKDVPINDVLSWAKRGLIDESWQELAKKLQEKDPAVTADEPKDFWAARLKRSWHIASYGKGTFVIDPPKIKPPQNKGGAPSSGGKGGGNNSGPQMKIDIPKPPTRDSWWAAEDTEHRKQWVLASFVESSGLFEVAPKRELTPCPECNGAGIITKNLTGGGALSYLCTRCAGAQNDQAVKFR